MKELIIAMLLFLSSFLIKAQTTYDTKMENSISKLTYQVSEKELDSLTLNFEQIGAASEEKWLPYYYASYSQIMKGRKMMMEGKTSELDPIADRAQKYLDQASRLESENAELYILQKMIHGLRLVVNPMERFQTELLLGNENLQKAKELTPNNPRVTLLEGQDLYFTPEEFGGSKIEARKLFEKSIEQIKTYLAPSKTKFYPNWGKAEAEHFLQLKP